MKNYLKLMRVKHYIKNMFIFVPLFFSYSFVDINLVIKAILSFVAFSLTCSVVYIINDIVDKEKDAKHPVKKNRPIASGKVSVKNAVILGAILTFISATLCFTLLNLNTYLVILSYFVLNLAYSFKLKNVALIDVLIIALGFIFRIYTGALAIGVYVSEWLLLTTFALSLFLGFGKRYGEKIRTDGDTRAVLNAYSLETLRSFMGITMALTIVFYSLYTILGNTIIHNAVFTVPFVVIGIFRYYMLLSADVNDGDPTDVILKDRIIQAIVLLYGIVTLGLIII